MTTLPRSSDSSVQVVVRLRPMNAGEKKHGTLPVVTASTQDRTVTVIKGHGSRQARSSFSFDNVFTAFSTQEEVFDGTLKPVIGDVLKGYESTVFAYGQTGTGKTHTMEGDLTSLEMQGIIPRSSKAIFEALKKPTYKEHIVTCSYLEIYNEELCDLLSDENHKVIDKKGNPVKLEIINGKRGTFCRGLVQIQVETAEDVLDLMQKAQNQRKIGETKMNKHSSRSHCIFTVTVQAKAQLLDADGIIDFTGKLHMVDLAGSECAKTANLDRSSVHTEVARERERMNINRSLLTLGRVISLLKESSNKKNSNIRIPYRDSKLTRILQESLGGRCKTVVIATLSPSITAIEESISTLNYAQSANGIVNKPVATSFLSMTSSTKGGNLKGCAMSFSTDSPPDNGKTVEYWHDMECRLQYMQVQVEEAQAALSRKHMQQQELMDRADKAESEKLGLEKKLLEATQELDTVKEDLSNEKERRLKTVSQLKITENNLWKITAFLKATQKTEQKLTEEAQTLIKNLKESIAEGKALYNLVQENHDHELKRREDTQKFKGKALQALEYAISDLSKLSFESERELKQILQLSEENSINENSSWNEVCSIARLMHENIKSLSLLIKQHLKDTDGVTSLVSSTSEIATHEINEIKKSINKSELLLTETCETGKQQLQNNGKQLYRFHQLHSEKVSNSLQSLEANILLSKKNISELIGSTLTTLIHARKDREALRSIHNDLLGGWRESSLRNVKDVKDEVIAESENVKKSLEKFEGEMKHIDEIESILDHQRDLVKNEGLSHISQVTEQKGDLVTQSEMIESANARRVQAQKIFMSNVMKNFQSMLQTQFQKLTDENERSHVELRTSNDGLQERNKSLGLGAQGIVEKVDKSSETLIMHTKLVRENDNNASVSMKQAKERLDFVADKTGQHQEMIKDYARRADDNMTSLATLDAASDKICKSIEDDGEQCSDYLSNTLLKETSTKFEELAQGADNMVNHCKDNLISDCSSTLNEILKPRNEVIESINNRAHNITTTLSTGKKKIEEIATTLHSKGEETAAFVLDCDKTLNNKVLKRRHEQISATKEKVALQIAKLTDVTSLNVTNSSVQTKAVKSQIEDFATNVMHSNEEVPPVVTKDEIQFTEELSSTPAEDIIIQNMADKSCLPPNVCDENEVNLLQITIPSISNKENIDINKSKGNEPKSTKSEDSMLSIRSPQSPFGKERVLNEDKSFKRSCNKAPRSDRKKLSNGSHSVKRSKSNRSVLTPNVKTSSARKTNRIGTPNRAVSKRQRMTSK